MPKRITVRTGGYQELLDITERVAGAVRDMHVYDGVCHIFTAHDCWTHRHENADPDVCADMIARLDELVPVNAGYRHAEGNAHAHIKATLVGQSAYIPVENRRLALGRWQGIFLAEFDGPRERTVIVSVVAE
ncbi:MAG TPA: secondary thiamine-phosphate synthase enzyme YjbQ [Dehalococcoidia bacterium]|nr:secondary thiamine-phosphate synthase enzyme YjbQ [Dehalococcoidia bacterium]